jgi:hypothetical protein
MFSAEAEGLARGASSEEADPFFELVPLGVFRSAFGNLAYESWGFAGYVVAKRFTGKGI